MARRRKKAEGRSRRLVRDASGQTDMFEKSYEEGIGEQRKGEVECLAMTFENDQARREYFLVKSGT